MKPIYECEWCSFRSTIDVAASHEAQCRYNPENIQKQEKLEWIKKHCPYRKQCWDEYDDFWGCVKNGSLGRHTPGCHPSSDCLQYCKGENLWEKI